MQRVIMKSKIHRATVTRADLDYEGSCGIAPELMRAADIVPGEQVHVVNVTNGSRAVTYVIEAGPVRSPSTAGWHTSAAPVTS